MHLSTIEVSFSDADLEGRSRPLCRPWQFTSGVTGRGHDGPAVPSPLAANTRANSALRQHLSQSEMGCCSRERPSGATGLASFVSRRRRTPCPIRPRRDASAQQESGAAQAPTRARAEAKGRKPHGISTLGFGQSMPAMPFRLRRLSAPLEGEGCPA